MSVYAPYSIEQTEYICASLRNGDVVVLNLRDTAAELGARILDFTFGAASMIGAQVDCPAPKVFVVCKGAALSQSEMASLQKQGVL